MNRDTITGIVGAAILVVAMIGVFQYERTIGAARAGLGDADGFEVASLPGPSTTGSTPLGEARDATVRVEQANLTNVTFTLKWSGTTTNTLSMAVTPPEGVRATPVTSESENDGEITLRVEVPNAAPRPGEPTTLGLGDWHVSVAFESSESTTPPGLPPVGRDDAVSWTLAVTYDAWAPRAASASS